MFRIKLTSLALALLFVSGGLSLTAAYAASVYWSPAYRKKVSTRVYKEGYERVFNAVADACEVNGYSVILSNKQTGVILTDYQPAGSALAGKGRVKLDFKVSVLKDGSTMVRLNMHCQVNASRGMNSIDFVLNEDNYRRVLDVVTKTVNRAKDTEAR
ncbi:MAG: hypothetical protein WC628_04760 [Candidatus Omnitrophota bacterium]